MIRNRLLQAQERVIGNNKRKYIENTAKLDAMSPLKVLTRGYSMTTTDKGAVVKSVDQVEIGQTIQIA